MQSVICQSHICMEQSYSPFRPYCIEGISEPTSGPQMLKLGSLRLSELNFYTKSLSRQQ